MNEFRLGPLSTVMLGVQSLETSLPFYRDKLGLAVRMQFEGFAFLDAGAVTLVLSEGLVRSTGKGAGATELVFSVDGVREGYEELRQRGIEFVQQPRNVAGTQWAANFHDPDGHILTLFGPEARSAQTSAA